MPTTPYVLGERVYEGAATLVYRATRRSDGAPVIFKLLKDGHAGPRDVAKLRHEHAILQDLALPGVIGSHGIVEHERTLALVLEDFGGKPLIEMLRTERLDLDAILRIGIAVSESLDSIHRRGILHKDIKPHNIVVEPGALTVKLIDFGIATSLSQEAPQATSPEALAGTLAYMSPEQTGRMNRFIDQRTDLYALGVTLYEMLTGALPFRTTDPMELIHSHIARIPAPPHEVSPGVPRGVSNIVMKLLAKAAEDRYQRASGLKADLEACLEQLRATGQIVPFPLGQRDVEDELRIQQKLYGREAELSALLAAWERVSDGRAELVLISGDAGIGKSALVHELQKAIVRRRGRFAGGKSDQINRSAPYAPVAQAFRDLLRQILSEHTDTLEVWKRRLEQAVGPNGQVLVELLPELGLILGPQPRPQEIGPAEAQNRFNLVFQLFLRVLATGDHPLVVFLDDVQLADPASFKLLQVLLCDPTSASLLVIVAFRDSEVSAAHPLRLAAGEIRKAGTQVHEISLAPLGISDVGALLADALRCEPGAALPLAELVLRKTHGNPFFVNQFIGTVHREGMLTFDAASRSFRWDLGRLEGARITDNVVELMADKLRRLRPETQGALKLAACIGHRFDLKTLATILEKTLTGAAADLWEALREGLVLPLNPEYRFYHGAEARDVEATLPPSAFDVSYRFLHDRVQQAAYSLLEGGHEQEVHLRIGRLLLSRSGGSPAPDELFEIVNQLNLGEPRITDPGERTGLARLNLAAGKRARAESALEAAASYLRVGLSLLDPASWEREYELTAALHEEAAACKYLAGKLDRAEALFDILLARVRTDRERAHVHDLRVVLYMTAGRVTDAVASGAAGLRLLGASLPESEEAREAAVRAEIAEAQALLAGRRPAELIDLPPLTDPDKRVLLELLTNLFIPAFIISPDLFTFVAVKNVTISLKHGHADASAHGYMAYGFILAAFFGRYEEAHELGELALALDERAGNLDLKCRLNALFGDYYHFRVPLREGLTYAARAREAGFASGDFIHLSYACTQTTAIRLALGDNLDDVAEEVAELDLTLKRLRIESSSAIQSIARQMIANLTGGTRDRSTLSDDAFDEAAFVEELGRPGLSFIAFRYHAVKLALLFLHGDHRGALSMALLGEQTMSSSVGQFLTTELSFYTCLTLAALYPEATADEREAHARRLDEHRARIAAWARSCPQNFRHKHLLVLAESARILGGEVDPADLYDQAIDAARESGFVRDEAMALELCAKYHLSRGKARIARAYMTDAHRAYLLWGATAKAEDIARRSPDLVLSASGSPSPDGARATLTATMTRKIHGEILDIGAILRAAQAIAGEIVLDKVLGRLMRLAIENAGAQRGALVLQREGRLIVEASAGVDPGDLRVNRRAPLETSGDIATSIVRYVARTHEPVLVVDAASEARFAGDPYIERARPRSVLCVPVLHQGRLQGVLYMENNAARSAFTQARREVSELLASQAAIAIDNALLYEHVERVSAELRRANEQLELDVARRTVELAERRRSEEERTALQEEVIRLQREMLLELSTPLIPITDRVMVMPLIGTMDAKRADQVLETALNGAAAGNAEIVIVDVTGLKRIDEEVVGKLTRMAGGLRLLGTGVVMTGIRADMARMLVEMDMGLHGIVTRGTLQSGIAYALGRAGL